ncbi:hypothetical protein [Paenibacillus sp. BAC0078]
MLVVREESAVPETAAWPAASSSTAELPAKRAFQRSAFLAPEV